jgi:hypothetical protein
MTLAVAHVDQSLTIDDPAFTTMLHALKTTAKSGESTDHARYHDVAQSSASSTIWVCHDMKMHGNVHVNSHGLTTHTILSLSLSLYIYIYVCVAFRRLDWKEETSQDVQTRERSRGCSVCCETTSCAREVRPSSFLSIDLSFYLSINIYSGGASDKTVLLLCNT